MFIICWCSFTDLYCTFHCILFCSPHFFPATWYFLTAYLRNEFLKDWSSFVPPFQWSRENLQFQVFDGNYKSDHLSCKFHDLHHRCVWKHKNASTNLEGWKGRSQLFRSCARENKCIISFVWHTIHTAATFSKHCPSKMHLLVTYMRNKLYRSRAREGEGGTWIKLLFVLSA